MTTASIATAATTTAAMACSCHGSNHAELLGGTASLAPGLKDISF